MFKKIGLRIRRVRLDQGVKQKDLARRIRISQGALTNFELGRRKISLDWLVKIARALEAPIEYFLEDIEPRVTTPALGAKEVRLLRAFQRLSPDRRLQSDVVHVLERISRHIGRGGRRRGS